MHIVQTELFSGMSPDFMKEFSDISVKESHSKGHYIFHEGARATHLYILLEGQINLRIHKNGYLVATIYHPGEVFGWSSLLGGKIFTATAECKEPTKVLKINAGKLQMIVEKDLKNCLNFYKGLATILGDRLLHSYKLISCAIDLLIRHKIDVPEN